MPKPCCGTPVDIDGIYQPLSLRLRDVAHRTYGDGEVSSHRIVMWVFSFYNAKDECPVCKGGLQRMRDWFAKYGLIDNPGRCVRIVVDDEAYSSAILDDMHIGFTPVVVTVDSAGKKTLVEGQTSVDGIIEELGIKSPPVNIFTDADGKIIDMLFEYPDDAWLDKYILPFIQKDSGLI